ncbi:hypothetical protein XENORESO_003202 [Xenotaenia resolanae]|uniref:Uncharacterized protein n=1 Tax=Xenotaenia resolanae TaxID=208358 RepID=A0ABV0X285_9TELE
MNGLSRQMTQFSIEVNQQLARICGDLATCNEKLSRLESQASYSEELQRKRRQNNPKIALLEARQSVLEAEELTFWKGVTIDLMSDEEYGSFEGASGWMAAP